MTDFVSWLFWLFLINGFILTLAKSFTELCELDVPSFGLFIPVFAMLILFKFELEDPFDLILATEIGFVFVFGLLLLS